MNTTFKRYLISSTTTFVTVFLISVGTELSSAHITPETLGWGIVLSIGFTALRTAVKAVIEAFSRTTGDLA
ncbi:MAG TPA: hypothetical protein VI937_02795 [Negativicutes bacterium]|nr:hypothetical protein [Negativicutes bacterium]